VFVGTFDGQPILTVKLDTPINGYGYWYVAEGIAGLAAKGTRVDAGTQVAVTQEHGTGIETGWGAANGYPAADPHYSEGDMTNEGRSFAAALGVAALPTGVTQPITV
jgi:hypothetical protein